MYLQVLFKPQVSVTEAIWSWTVWQHRQATQNNICMNTSRGTWVICLNWAVPYIYIDVIFCTCKVSLVFAIRNGTVLCWEATRALATSTGHAVPLSGQVPPSVTYIYMCHDFHLTTSWYNHCIHHCDLHTCYCCIWWMGLKWNHLILDWHFLFTKIQHIFISLQKI